MELATAIGFGFTVFAIMVAFYFLPVIIASSRDHDRTGLIFIINLLLGWLIVPWLVLVIWAFLD